jgi:hypothetical protein
MHLSPAALKASIDLRELRGPGPAFGEIVEAAGTESWSLKRKK